jgi:hypothetical protein
MHLEKSILLLNAYFTLLIYSRSGIICLESFVIAVGTIN